VARKQAEKNAKKATLKAEKNAAKSAAKLEKAAAALTAKLAKNAAKKAAKKSANALKEEAASAAKELAKKMKTEMKVQRNATRKAEKEAAAAAWKNAQSTAHNDLTFALGKAPRVANSQRLAAIRYAGSTLSVSDFLKIKNAKNKTRKSSGPRENVRNIVPSFNVCEQCKLKKLLENS
jgi:hypothetical protein